MSDQLPRSIGKYEVLSILGKGGMGVVYKARDPLIDRTVAIKTIASGEFSGDDDLLARLRMEAKSAGRLTHPNIVTVFEFGEQEGLAYLAMEFVEGANLASVISSGIHLSLNTKLEIMIQIADGMAYAHELGVIHRDIKPSNICLTLRGDPKILDFGLARFDQTRLTKTGLTSGTVMYMSPERMRGESGPSDDIFAMGAVAYEILTGRRAFPGETYRETVRNIMSGEHPVPPSKIVDVPTELDAVIAKATAVDKAKRYQSAAEFARALREVMHSQTFQRRAQREASMPQNDLNTVAIHFSTNNPYTAPDFAPTASAFQQPGTAPQTVTAVRTPEPRTELFDEGKTDIRPQLDPTVAMDSPAFTRPVPLQPPPDAMQPTVAMKAPAADPMLMAPTEAISSARLPVRERGSSSAMAPTEAMIPPTQAMRPPAQQPLKEDDTFFGRTRTVVAKAIARVKSGPVETGVAGLRQSSGATAAVKATLDALETRTAKSSIEKVTLWASAAGIAAAAVAIGAAAERGAIATVSIYAAAVVAWFFLVRNCGSLKGLQASAIVGVIAAAALTNGVALSPSLAAELETGRLVASQSAEGLPAIPPFTSLLLAGWSAIGGLAIYRALLGAVSILLIAWLLWDREKPERTIAVATFPLLVVEGIVHARIEAVAAAALVGAVVATTRRRYGIAAFLGILATGVAVDAAGALPVLYGAAWHMIVFLSTAAVTLVVPKLIWPTTTAWSNSLTTLAATSPVLAFLNQRIAALLTEWGVIDVLNAFSNAITTRAGSAPRPVVAEVLATVILVVALLVIISILSSRAKVLESAMADGIGLLLLLCMVREPAAWLLVAPFAILGNRTLWLLVALCSPILLFASADAGVALTVWAVSLGVPLLAWIGIRIGSGLKKAPQEAVLPH